MVWVGAFKLDASSVTNAAGALNHKYAVGDVVVLQDVCNTG